MAKYACTGGHTDVSYPTRRLKSDYRAKATSKKEGIGGADEETSGSMKTSDKRSKASPLSIKSPEKKKQHRRRAKVWGDIALDSSDEDDGSNSEWNVSSLPQPNRLFAACLESSDACRSYSRGKVLYWI